MPSAVRVNRVDASRFLQLVTHLTGATVGSSIRSFPRDEARNHEAAGDLCSSTGGGGTALLGWRTGRDHHGGGDRLGVPQRQSIGRKCPLGMVVGVAVDPAGNLYLTDVGNHMVFKASADGTLTILAGNGSQWFSGDGGPATSASLALPEGVAVDGAGNVYIADEENHNVRKVSPDGTHHHRGRQRHPYRFIDGEGGDPADDLGDGGSATRASLSQPNGLAVDGAGNLYIADEENHRIRKVSTSGIITTIAGTGVKGLPATPGWLPCPAGTACRCGSGRCRQYLYCRQREPAHPHGWPGRNHYHRGRQWHGRVWRRWRACCGCFVELSRGVAVDGSATFTSPTRRITASAR